MINSEECTDSEWIWGLKNFNKSGLQSEISSCKVNIKAVTLAIFPRDLCFSSELQNLITPNRTVLDSQYSSLSLILSHLVCLCFLFSPSPNPAPFFFPLLYLIVLGGCGGLLLALTRDGFIWVFQTASQSANQLLYHYRHTRAAQHATDSSSHAISHSASR